MREWPHLELEVETNGKLKLITLKSRARGEQDEEEGMTEYLNESVKNDGFIFIQKYITKSTQK